MFIENLLLVAGQAGVLLALMAAGALLYKIKLITDAGVSEMTSLLFWLVTPCLLIQAFSREFDMAVAKQLGIFALFAIGATLASLLIGVGVYSKAPEDDRGVMAFGTAFTNCGFMGLPMANALYGEEGVMFASIFVAVFHILQWTAGYAVLNGKGISVKKMIVNPGVIGIAVSLPIFLFSIKLPGLVSQSVGYIAGINTPLAMIIVGAQLARSNILKALTSGKVYLVTTFRLLVVPAAAMAFVYFFPCGLETLPVKTFIMEIAAPTAVTTALISQQVGKNYTLAGYIVALSTLLSTLTMPIFASLSQVLFG